MLIVDLQRFAKVNRLEDNCIENRQIYGYRARTRDSDISTHRIRI